VLFSSFSRRKKACWGVVDYILLIVELASSNNNEDITQWLGRAGSFASLITMDIRQWCD